MAKDLKQWLDDFTANGFDPKDVTNWPEQGGGGVVEVDELPEVGKEDTIYALRKEVPGSYSWALVAAEGEYYGPSDPIIVVDSEDTIDRELIAARFDADPYLDVVEIYIRDEDIIQLYGKRDNEIILIVEIARIDGFFEYLSIVTKYNEEITEDHTYQHVEFPDGTTRTYEVTPDATYNPYGFMLLINSADKLLVSGDGSVFQCYDVAALPTAKEVIDNKYYNSYGDAKRDFVTYEGDIPVTTRYYTSGEVDDGPYRFDEDRQVFIRDDETEAVYEGKLEWEKPYEIDITNVLYFASEDYMNTFLYIPTPSTIKIVKYVYENGEYINISEPTPAPSLDNRFVELETGENIYFGDKISNLKIQYDFQKYYEDLGEAGLTIIPYDAIIGNYDYRDHEIIFTREVGSNDYSEHRISIFLKYDEEGNVWGHCTITPDWEHQYLEIASAIKVATADDMADFNSKAGSDFTFPIVEFSIPENLPDYDSFAITKILGDDWSRFSDDCVVKIYKD